MTDEAACELMATLDSGGDVIPAAGPLVVRTLLELLLRGFATEGL